MARKRKTKAERLEEWAMAEGNQWEEFRPELEAAKTYSDALKLVSEAPAPDSPGRRYYSNLRFFLTGFIPPHGSSYGEKALYLELIARMDAAGDLKPGTRK